MFFIAGTEPLYGRVPVFAFCRQAAMSICLLYTLVLMAWNAAASVRAHTANFLRQTCKENPARKLPSIPLCNNML